MYMFNTLSRINKSSQLLTNKISSYLNIGVAQSQPGSLVQFSGVLQDFHDGQEVAAVLGPFIGGESQA